MDILKLIVSKYPYWAFIAQAKKLQNSVLAWVAGFIEMNIDMLI
ncbi:MAG: hypothetical protein VKK32_06500 [Candidatus Melainabacteria bacterium]|nr:hypothetical protein [Candidatus Melainabacteria bacterium]